MWILNRSVLLKYWYAWVGIGLLIIWNGVFPSTRSSLNGVNSLDLPSLTIFIANKAAILVTFVVVAFASRNVERKAGRFGIRMVPVFALLLGAASIAVATSGLPTPFLAGLISEVGAGVTFAVFICYWFIFLLMLSPRDAMLLIAAGVALEEFERALFSTSEVTAFLVLVIIEVCVTLMLNRTGDLEAVDEERADRIEHRTTFARAGAFAFACSMVAEFIKRVIARSSTFSSGEELWLHIFAAVLLTVMFAVLFCCARKARIYLSAIYHIMLAFVILSISSVMIAPIFPEFAFIFSHPAFSLVTYCIWMVIINVVFSLEESPLRFSALVLALSYGGTIVGQLAYSFCTVLFGATQEANAIIVIVGLLVTFVTFFVIFPADELVRVRADATVASERTFEEICARISEKHGLSRRESEVFALMAKGRNSAFIQEALVISRNTVSTHRTNIYRKLDVHTHQELLDVLDGASR